MIFAKEVRDEGHGGRYKTGKVGGATWVKRWPNCLFLGVCGELMMLMQIIVVDRVMLVMLDVGEKFDIL